MKLFSKGKDGGPDSKVTGYWLCEFKRLFSVAILRFDEGGREAYHNHAFNSISWVLNINRCMLVEWFLDGSEGKIHTLGLKPIITKRDTFHKVESYGTTWVFTIRGPWSKTWKESVNGEEITLTNGRKVVE